MSERLNGSNGEGSMRCLGSNVYSVKGSVVEGTYYYEGHHPGLGQLTNQGWSGAETVVTSRTIKPVGVIRVLPVK